MRHRATEFSVPRSVFLTLVTAALASPAAAQWPPLSLPQASPAAAVAQTVGVTEIAVEYHRPQVKGRKVWGELVPYGEVWRAGANENTTISFSTPVAVQGKSLPAGKYGVHMIPSVGEWTVIFSNAADAWGSFAYDAKEDALRIQVTPGAGELQESLEYSFDEVTGNSADVVLSWELVRLAIPIQVDTKAATVAALRSDLTGLARFFWQPWNAAANYCIQNQVSLDEAVAWIDRSIGMNANFINTKTKSKLLRLQGDTAGADALLASAIGNATEQEMNQHGYELLGEGKNEEAVVVFRKNVKDHPASWNVHDSLAEGLVAAGKTVAAIAVYKKALAMAPPNQKARIERVLSGLASKR